MRLFVAGSAAGIRRANERAGLDRNASSPRVASSSKDGTVRVWNSKLRKLEFNLGGHTASVNAVRWGGEGVIYTASSDRTVKLWDGNEVSLLFAGMFRWHWSAVQNFCIVLRLEGY